MEADSVCGVAENSSTFRGFAFSMAVVDVVMFARTIPLYAFVFAAGLTVLFTLLVNLILYPKVNLIDMASALKAIE